MDLLATWMVDSKENSGAVGAVDSGIGGNLASESILSECCGVELLEGVAVTQGS